MNPAGNPHVTLTQCGELPLLHIANRHASAIIALQGAQVLEYRRQGATQPLIWLSEQAAYRRGQPVRGGIPVCWPWFGSLDRNPEAVRRAFAAEGAPAHGLVRGADWLPEHIDEDDDATVITLRCPLAELGIAALTDIGLQLQVTVGATLGLRLRTTNHGGTPFSFSQALHSYFAVSDIDAVAVPALAGTRYIETLENWEEKDQRGAVTFSGETDRIYLDPPAHIDIVDRAWQRRIALHSAGSRSAVVWNPWIDKAQRLNQFAADAWQRMLCIESANVLGDAVTLAPGETHVLQLDISELAL